MVLKGYSGLGENGYMYTYGWVPLLFTCNYHNIVNPLYPKTKKKKKKNNRVFKNGLNLETESCSNCLGDGGAWREGQQLEKYVLEKEMATHSSVLAWGIPGTGEPGGLPSMRSHRVGHDWSDLAAAAATKTVTNLMSAQRGRMGAKFRFLGQWTAEWRSIL